MITKNNTNNTKYPCRILTEWGSATIKSGYYAISSEKEGNKGKRLHRLIYEKNYGKIPDGYVIHHKNEDKTNNCIMNLQLMTNQEHTIYHNKQRTGKNNPFFGKKHSKKTKKLLSTHKKGKNNPHYGTHLSEEHKQKISESMAKIQHKMSINESKRASSTGYYNVVKKKDKQYKQGFVWRYRYKKEGKPIDIYRKTINELKKEVQKRGLHWEQF